MSRAVPGVASSSSADENAAQVKGWSKRSESVLTEASCSADRRPRERSPCAPSPCSESPRTLRVAGPAFALVSPRPVSAAGSLKDAVEERGVKLELPKLRQSAIAAVEPELADRLLYRLVSAVIGRAAAGERIRLSVDRAGDHWRIAIPRPAALRGSGGALLNDPGASVADPADVAAALQLRLVRGLARVAGGDLGLSSTALSLLLPQAGAS